MNIVADSSTLILACKITAIKVLYEYVDKAVIPEGVFREVVEKGKEASKDDALIIENLIKEGKIEVKKIENKNQVLKMMQDFKVGNGEAEALTLAMEEKAGLLVDDAEAIKVCKVYDIKFITALALIIRAFKDKKFDKKTALRKIDSLSMIGYYSNDIINDAIRECD